MAYETQAVRDARANVNKLKAELHRAEEALTQTIAKAPKCPLEHIQRLATALHKLVCHHNHVDGCGWEYGSWDNPLADQQSYYDWAMRLAGPMYRDIDHVRRITENIEAAQTTRWAPRK